MVIEQLVLNRAIRRPFNIVHDFGGDQIPKPLMMVYNAGEEPMRVARIADGVRSQEE